MIGFIPYIQQNHLSELTRSQDLPLEALNPTHVEIILELLQKAYDGIKADYPAALAEGDEKHINSLMVDRLNHLVSDDPLAGLIIRVVSRGTETKNFDASRFEMRPDIQISLTGRQHLFPLIVECKLIDIGKGKTVEKYCVEGLARFTTGDYAWTNREAMMLAYVRDTSSIANLLSPYLKAAMLLTPPEFAVVKPPEKCMPALQDAAVSEHGRYFSYVHGANIGKQPGNIAIWHLWVN